MWFLSILSAVTHRKNLCAAGIHGERIEFLSVWSALSRSARALQNLPKKSWNLCLVQNANDAARLFAYLNLDYSKHFWLKVNIDLEAKPAASRGSAVFGVMQYSQEGWRECAPCLQGMCVCLCACIYVCKRARVCIWMGCVTEKKKLIYHNMHWNLPGVSPLSKSSLMKHTAEPISAYYQWGGPKCQPITCVRFSGATGRIDERSKSQWRITVSCLR